MPNNEATNSESMAADNLFVGVRDFFLDKKFVAGTVLGLSLLAGGYAISANSGAPSGGSPNDPSSALLSDQESVIAQQLKTDAQACAQGDTEGTVGHAVNMALKAHLEIASASPNVERLFSVDADCFAGLSSLIDLSFAIPSLATILSAAQNAVMAYAKKKICSSVSKVTGMVTEPINQAIGKANGYIGVINGMGDFGMSTLDPNLGADYNIGQSGEYTTNQPNKDKTSPSTGDSTGGGAGAGAGGGDQGAGNYNQVQQLTQQLGQVQASLGPAQQRYAEAQQNYANAERAHNICLQTGNSNCSQAGLNSARQQLNGAQQNLNSIQSQITSLQNQINSLLGSGGGGSSSSGVSQRVASPQSEGATLTEKLGNLFQ